jgi:UDP-N-acetylglucosamine 1-carboxyvinyltransferase
MAVFEVTGGKRLKGEIIPQGAKNEALQIISAVLLTSEKVVINNIPNIIDVNSLISLLKDLGVKVEKLSDSSYSYQADTIDLGVLASDAFQK